MEEEITKIKQKLLEMKKEYAQKQKKLEKARRAARVRAHVKKKIKEHEELESKFTPIEDQLNLEAVSKNTEGKGEHETNSKASFNSASMEEEAILHSKAKLHEIELSPCHREHLLSTSNGKYLISYEAVCAFQDDSQIQVILNDRGNSKNPSEKHVLRDNALDIEKQISLQTVTMKSLSSIALKSNGTNHVSKSVPKDNHYYESALALDSKDFDLLEQRSKKKSNANMLSLENFGKDCFQAHKDVEIGKAKQRKPDLHSRNKFKTSIDKNKLSTPQYPTHKTKVDLKLKTIKNRDRCLDKHSGWIDTDFYTDHFDFEGLPNHQVITKKEIVEKQDKSGWLSTVKKEDRTNTTLPNKRTIATGTDLAKSKVFRKSLRSTPFDKVSIRSPPKIAEICKASVTSFISSNAVMQNDKVNTGVDDEETICATNFPLALNSFQPAMELQKPLTIQKQSLEDHFLNSVPNEKKNTKICEELKFATEKVKNLANLGGPPAVSTENILPRNSDSEEDIIKASQSEVKAFSKAIKKSGLKEPSLQLHNTQESLSLTPTFKSTLCSLGENHRNTQNNIVVEENNVTDSEFLNILGIQLSQGHNELAEVDSNEGRPDLRIFRKDHVNLSQVNTDPITGVHTVKENENNPCSVFDNFLPPSQTSSEFLEYTELDSIPFSQFELSEDLLSSGDSHHKQRSRHSTKALVMRRSRRISAAQSFEHRLFRSELGSDSIPSSLSKYKKNRRPSQAQQRKAAMVISIFQYLQDKVKESGSACEFELTSDFNTLKKLKISEHIQNDGRLDCEVINEVGTNVIPFHHVTSFDKLKVNSEAQQYKFNDGGTISCSQSQQTFYSPVIFTKTKHSSSTSCKSRTEASRLLMTQEKAHLENHVVETDIDKSKHIALKTEIVPANSSENYHKLQDENKRPRIFPEGTLISETPVQPEECSHSKSPNGSINNSAHMIDHESHQKLGYKACSEILRNSEDEEDDKSYKIKYTNEQKCRPVNKMPSSSFENQRKVNAELFQSCNDLALNCKQKNNSQTDKSPMKNTSVNVDMNQYKRQYKMKDESNKHYANLKQAMPQSDVYRNIRNVEIDQKAKIDAAAAVNKTSVLDQNFEDASNLKQKLKPDLACNGSFNNSGNNLSPISYRKDNISSPFYNGKDTVKENFASPSNIMTSLLSPVTPVLEKEISKSVRSLSRKSISFTSTPIRKPGPKCNSVTPNQLHVDFESPISKSRSASSASFINADLTNSQNMNRSQDDLTQVYNKALSVLFIPQNAHASNEINDKNDSTSSEIPTALELSTNLSLVPVCDESYPSPGQMPVLDQYPLEISTSIRNDCAVDVTGASETNVTNLSMDKTSNISKTLPMSPHVVHPWRKLARTATTPMQVLEAETSSSEHVSFSFTSHSMRDKSKLKHKPEMKSNLRFKGCFQSDFQDAVVSLLCGRVKNQSHPHIGQAFIVSVQASSLTVWGEDSCLGWITELDWRLSPEAHILKACLMPANSRVVVLVTGWMASSLFASVLTYEWDTEETVRLNIPFEELPFQICSLMRVEVCPASDIQLYLALSSEDHHVIQKTQVCGDQKELVPSSLFQSCRGKVISLLVVEGKKDALISLTYDQKVTIWNCSLGVPLKAISVDSSIPCLEALVSARSRKGVIFLDSMWRVYDGNCGGLIVMNPLNGKLRILHMHQVPNNTWRRVDSFKTEGRFLSAVSNQGSLCVWDRFSGALLGNTKSKTTTCAALSVSQTCELQLLVGEIHGCIHIYNNSSPQIDSLL